MRKSRRDIAAFLLSSFACLSSIVAQDVPSAGSLFPKETQGFVRVAHLPKLSERWDATQIGILSKLPGMSAFWDEQGQEIEGRLADAGWQLNMHPKDIYEICGGQVAVGWIDRSTNVRKPYAIGVVVDTTGHEKEAAALLERVEKELKQKQGSVEQIKHAGHSITKTTSPKKAGDVIVRESFYSQAGQQLIASDDLDTIKGMLDAIAQNGEGRLEKTELYQTATSKLSANNADSDVDYFIRPIGFAKIMRSISKKTGTRQVDMLKVLESQGFDKLLAARGQVRIASSDYDFLHESFVLASNPLPKSVQILDFPNNSSKEVPAWASSETASLTSVCWNIKDAFWKVEGIFDEVAGAPGCFAEVMESFLTDAKGPQIDLKKEVMPYLTNEIYSLTDCVKPITPDSKRSLIAIRVTDSAKMSNVIGRFMKIENEAKSFDFEGVRIWVVSHEEGDTAPDVDNGGFEDFPSDDEEEKEEEPWLNRWAIAVHNDFILFSSHPEYLTETIKTFKSPNINGQLQTEEDVARGLSAVQRLTSNDPSAVWQVNRSSRSFQMQYELFRQDKLPQSRSMMASIMDRLLRPKQEDKNNAQRVKGNRLPEFQDIQKYLMPSGMVVRSTPDGWRIQSFVLGPNATTDQGTTALTAERSEESDVGQAASGTTVR